MDRYMKRAEELRAASDRHYNCAQAVLIPFAETQGIDTETAYKTAANFGSGMKMGSVCGAITGGLMALGLFGIEDAKDVNRFCRKMREGHDGLMNCSDLLKRNAELGGDKKQHCDGMVYDAVRAVTEILAEKGM